MKTKSWKRWRQKDGCQVLTRKGFSTKGGFTLIEAMVAVVILVVLIIIALPVMGRARENARKAQCVARLKAIGTALSMYIGNNGGKMPYGVYQGSYPGMSGWPTWEDFLAPYMGEGALTYYKRCFECPSSPQGSDTKKKITAAGYETSYTYNSDVFLMATEQNQRPPLMFSQLQQPSGTLVLACGSERGTISWNDVDSPKTVGFDKHPGGANALFADGHVESVTAATINQVIATHQASGRKVLRN